MEEYDDFLNIFNDPVNHETVELTEEEQDMIIDSLFEQYPSIKTLDILQKLSDEE